MNVYFYKPILLKYYETREITAPMRCMDFETLHDAEIYVFENNIKEYKIYKLWVHS